MQKKPCRLGLNIDHCATLRNARGGFHPCPVLFAQTAIGTGLIDVITVHLREDRRHIKDEDLARFRMELLTSAISPLKNSDDSAVNNYGDSNNGGSKNITTEPFPLNLEMAATKQMLQIALHHKPEFACIVPEKRQELTTEGGLDLSYNQDFLKSLTAELQENGTEVSLFIEPSIKQLDMAKEIGAIAVEIHTGKFCDLYQKFAPKKGEVSEIERASELECELNKIKQAVSYACAIGLKANAGHGLCYETTKIIGQIAGINEVNIGHFIIGESLFFGIEKTLHKIKSCL